MTLTEFLLARIAEDERLVTEYPGLTPDFPPKWALGLYYEDEIAMTLTVSADRVLAECEAKRRIVEEAAAHQAAEADAIASPVASASWYARSATLGYILRLLALPYSDHPDYDETWRP
ncbi:DUF6221 family protein [Cellulosimicrobium funkei]|uniref:DUF6221 family protein n=1 Tax=Cellulosimicrobium funkei TaxID=264251 RepID=UPI0034435A90